MNAKPTGVTIEGYELVQVIQNLDGKTPLIPGKAAVLRVYTNTANYAGDKISADLNINKKTNEPIKTLNAQLTLIPNSSTDIEIKRKHFHSSLNFFIPGNLINSTNKYILNINDQSSEVRIKSIRNGNIFCLRTIGIRYSGNTYDSLGIPQSDNTGRKRLQKTYQPHSNSIREFESLTKRCLPVSDFKASHITIDGPKNFKPPFPKTAVDHDSYVESNKSQKEHLMTLHTFLMAVRSMDIEIQGDSGNNLEETYYYGMFDGPTGELRGAVSDVPAETGAQFTGNVGVGPADAEGYYGLHELCHLLGALHPGDPGLGDDDATLKLHRGRLGNGSSMTEDDRKNSRNRIKEALKGKRHDLYSRQDLEDVVLEKPGSLNAHIGKDTKPDRKYVGLDIGDKTHPIIVKHYSDHYDIMTYRYNLWMSNYIYELLAEKLSKPFVNIDYDAKDIFRVIGSYDKNSRDKFKIHYILPVTKLLPDNYQIRDGMYSPDSADETSGFGIEFVEDTKQYFVKVAKQRKPEYVNGIPEGQQEIFSEWHAFQIDLGPNEGKSIKSIKLGDEIYENPKTKETLRKSLDTLIGELIAFNNDCGFKIRLNGIPADCQFAVAVKNTEAGNPWQTVAVESIQERLDRQKDNVCDIDIYIDKHAIERNFISDQNKDPETLNVRTQLIRGFEHDEQDYTLDTNGTWTRIPKPGTTT